jgi:hypothetical protein
MTRWTLPYRLYKRKPATKPYVIFEELFSNTLHSYDFNRNTWYPNIPRQPLDPEVSKRFAEYEEVQFTLLKDKHLKQQEYNGITQQLSQLDKAKLRGDRTKLLYKEDMLKNDLQAIEVKLIEHAKKYASLLELINLQISIEKAELDTQQRQITFEDYLRTGCYIEPQRDSYLICNEILPFETATNQVQVEGSSYKPPMFTLEEQVTPDIASHTSFPSLGNTIAKKVVWGKP